MAIDMRKRARAYEIQARLLAIEIELAQLTKQQLTVDLQKNEFHIEVCRLQIELQDITKE